MLVPRSLELALLDLIAQRAGAASWHWIATNLPRYQTPPAIDVLAALRALAARGWIQRSLRDDGMDRWAITASGQARLAAHAHGDPGAAASPLSPDELDELIAAMGTGGETLIRAVIPLAEDSARLIASLRQVLTTAPELAGQVAFAGATLEPGARSGFARELLDHPRPDVRRALFEWIAPGGSGARWLPEDVWHALVRAGLDDPDPAVREAAEAVAARAGERAPGSG